RTSVVDTTKQYQRGALPRSRGGAAHPRSKTRPCCGLGRDCQASGRKALQETACIAKPDTILAWYRKLVAQKFDGSKKRGLAGRPRVDAAIEVLVVKLAHDWTMWVSRCPHIDFGYSCCD